MTKVLFLQIMTTTMMVVMIMMLMEFATVTESRRITTRVRIYLFTSLIDSVNFFGDTDLAEIKTLTRSELTRRPDLLDWLSDNFTTDGDLLIMYFELMSAPGPSTYAHSEDLSEFVGRADDPNALMFGPSPEVVNRCVQQFLVAAGPDFTKCACAA